MPELLSMVVQKGAQCHNSIPVTLDVLSVLHLQSGACWSLQALKLGRLPAHMVQPNVECGAKHGLQEVARRSGLLLELALIQVLSK